MKNGDFSELVDARGQADHHLRSGDRPRRQRRSGRAIRSPATRSRPTASMRRRRGCCSTSRIPTARRRDSRTGSRTSATTSTSTRTSSGTGSARSTTTSAARTAPSSAGARTSATRCATPPRSAAARRRTASCRCSAPTTRSSATGCTSSAAARCSTSAAATPTTSRAASPTTRSASTRRQFGWPASLVSQLPAASVGGMFPVFTFDQFVQLSRGFGPNTNKIFSVQPNVSLTRGAHNIRSGLDMPPHQRLQRQLRQRRRADRFHPGLHPQHDQQHQHARGQRLRVVPARRAVGRQRAGQPVPALLLELRRALDPGRLAGHQQADAEPRLPLGLQQPRPRGAEPAELRVRPDHRQPGFGARRASR